LLDKIKSFKKIYLVTIMQTDYYLMSGLLFIDTIYYANLVE